MNYILILIFILFLLWYYGIPKKISKEEAQELKIKLKKAMRNENQPDNKEVIEFSRLMQSDDGKPYVMVNLIKYREKALESAKTTTDDSMKKYYKIMLPNLFMRACHPIYMGKTMGRFIGNDDDVQWEEVAFVRYRSRRDMIKMVIALQEDRSSRLEKGEDYPNSKDEAVEYTQVFPAKTNMHLPYLPMIVGIVLILINYMIK